MTIETLVRTTVETKTGTLQRRIVGEGVVPKVLVIDADSSLHIFYKTNLEKIVGRGNVTIVSNVSEAFRVLRLDFYSAYVVDPFIQGGGRNDWGFDLIEYIRRQEGNYDLVWVLSNDHFLLKESEGRGIRHAYTKREPELADGYETKEQFIKDMEVELGRGDSTISDTH